MSDKLHLVDGILYDEYGNIVDQPPAMPSSGLDLDAVNAAIQTAISEIPTPPAGLDLDAVNAAIQTAISEIPTSSASGISVQKFEFAYDTPALNEGVVAFTPAEGDVLLDMWFDVDVAWNGTTPKADAGYFDQNIYGFWRYVAGGDAGGSVDLNVAGTDLGAGTANSGEAPWGSTQGKTSLLIAQRQSMPTTRAYVPSRLLDKPIKVVVSTDGTRPFPGYPQFGVAPGATQGHATLFAVLGTPS